MSGKVAVAQAQLLSRTLERCHSNRFYSDHWRGTIPSLTSCPLTTKALLVRAGEEARMRDGQPATETFTMGTTGPAFAAPRGGHERAMVRRLFRRLSSRCFERPRVLDLVSPHHGDRVSVGSRAHVHRLSIYDNGSFGYAAELLQRSFAERGVEARCTVLRGLEPHVRAFASFVERSFGRLRGCALETVVVYGATLTSRSRRQLESVFSASVVDRYSISEAFGGGNDSGDGVFRMDPWAIWQVVDGAGVPVARGRFGRVCVTTLFPFQQVQPLVRYDAGDIGIAAETDGVITTSIALLGRATHCVMDPGGEWIVSGRALYEFLDGRLDVSREPALQDASQVEQQSRIGAPRFSMRLDDHEGTRKIAIAVCAESGSVSPDLRDGLMAVVLNCHGVRPAVEEGGLAVEVDHDRAAPAGYVDRVS